MNNRTKKPYETPEITLTQIMVENTICSASANITNLEGTKNGAIQDQTVNTKFTPTFDSTTEGSLSYGWNVTDAGGGTQTPGE